MRDYDPRYPEEYGARPSGTGYGRGAAPNEYPDSREYPARRPDAGRASGAYEDYPARSAPARSYGEGGYAGGRTGNPYGDDLAAGRTARTGGYGDDFDGYAGGRAAGRRGGDYAPPPPASYDAPAAAGAYGSIFDGGYESAGTAHTGSYGAPSRGAYGEAPPSGGYDAGYAASPRDPYATGSYTTDYGTGRGAVSRTGSYSTDYGSARGASHTGSYGADYGSARGASRTGSYGADYSSARGASHTGSYGADYEGARGASRTGSYGADYGSARGASRAGGYDTDYEGGARVAPRAGTYESGYGSASRRSYGGAAFEDTYKNPYGGGRSSRPGTSSLYDDEDDDEEEDGLSSRKAAVKHKNQVLNIWITCLSVLLVVCILTGLLLPNMLRAETPPPATSASTSEADTYNKDANLLPLAELGDTVLAQTEDAGTEYVADTLFIGDSNTLRMMSYTSVPEITLDNCIGIESMGIQSVPSTPCVQFEGDASLSTIPEAVATMQPLRVILTFGTNNASSPAEADSFITSYRAAIEAIRAAYSYTDIIIGAIPPVAKANSSNSVTMTTIDTFNVALAKLAQEMELKFLNWSEVLKDPATGYCAGGYVIEDGIHLSEEGVVLMVDYVRTHSHITEDTRPKPLKDIPKHILPAAEGAASSASSLPASSSAASSTPSGVKVVYGTLEHVIQSSTVGGKIQVAGQTTNSYVTYLQPKATCPTAVAVPADGYRFVYWAVSVGSIPDRESTTLANFIVWPTLAQGDTLYITAIFEGIPASTTPAPSSAAPPPSSTAPAATVSLNLTSSLPAVPAPTSSKNPVAPGETVTLTAATPSGYQFSGWSSEGTGSFGSTTSPTTTFTVPAGHTGTINIMANYN